MKLPDESMMTKESTEGKKERKARKELSSDDEMWSLCGYHTFLLLIIKLHFSAMCARDALLCVYDFMLCVRHHGERKKERFSCLIIQISCYLMAHIIIIKRETGKASANKLSLVEEVKVSSCSLCFLLGLLIISLNIFLISVCFNRRRQISQQKSKETKALLLMILMMIY